MKKEKHTHTCECWETRTLEASRLPVAWTCRCGVFLKTAPPKADTCSPVRENGYYRCENCGAKATDDWQWSYMGAWLNHCRCSWDFEKPEHGLVFEKTW